MMIKNVNFFSGEKYVLIATLILLIFFFITPSNGASQKSTDSLENILGRTRGVERIEILSLLIQGSDDSIKTLNYFKEAVKQAHELNLPWHEWNAYNILLEGVKGAEAIAMLDTVLSYFQKQNFQTGIGNSYSHLGSQYLLMNNYKKAEEFQRMALDVFTRINYPYGISLANERLGVLFMIKNEFLKALDYYYLALKINQKESFGREEANSLYHIGLTELYLGNYQEATNHILSSLRYWEQINYAPNIWNCNELLGNIYIRLNVFDKSLSYHQRALQVRLDAIAKYTPKGQPATPAALLGLAYSFNNIAEVYLNLHQYDSAYFYATKALKIKEAKNSVASRNDVANSWLNMGNIYRNLGKSDSAMLMLTKAAETYKSLQNGSSYAEALYGIGNIYIDNQNYNKASAMFVSGLQKSIEVSDKNNIKTGYKLLSDLYSLTRDYKRSLEYYLHYADIKDSIFNTERPNAIEELQIRYEVDKQQQKIENQGLIIVQKKRQIIFALIGTGVIVFFAVLFIILILKNKRQKEILLKKEADNLRKDLELKNRELVCNVSNIYTKNMVINKVAKTLSKSIRTSDQTDVLLINEIIRELQQNMDETSWKEFEYRFSRVHESFYKTLDVKYPDLTHAERKVCAMLKLDMSSKEIASITMTLPESVDTTRSHIRKKLGLEKDENLSEFLNKL